ncbi:unnamed protein product [Vitrella brassicaformis CCMP3155]|uniref:Epoxide hydrolase N-terminal domain-containing protein n=1 Tax=Vitrella brassicaformis (strain CCMP3155) TaxID=1169540 RepID=A0A0G4FJ61_VITBC|nr:unnamed protein product [Vitrella brassicaformis CCMP3155]|eukprot:CEM13086.1 unnamed protein product [Vitrella brassicaformis CCMP3155]
MPVDESVSEDLKQRLSMSRWPSSPQIGAPGEYGVDWGLAKTLAAYWRDGFDWSSQAAALESVMPQFTVEIEGLTVHFAHAKATDRKKGAILALHGWPDAFTSCRKIVPLLTSYGYDVVCPSLIGYGFSSPAKEPGMGAAKMASIFVTLMKDVLKYNKYLVHGGDWGALISVYVAVSDPQSCVGLHSTNCISKPPLNPFAQFPHGIVRTSRFLYEEGSKIVKNVINSMTTGSNETDTSAAPEGKDESEESVRERSSAMWKETGYLHEQATKPHTLGVALNDSPAGLLAWIVEKWTTWSDVPVKSSGERDLLALYSKDEILALVHLYWITGSITSSIQLYKEEFFEGLQTSLPYVETPTACAVFPRELMKPPKYWVEGAYNLKRFNTFDKGGHFAMMEQPEALAKDIDAFYTTLLEEAEQKARDEAAKKEQQAQQAADKKAQTPGEGGGGKKKTEAEKPSGGERTDL